MAAIAEFRAFLAASLVTPVERTRTESVSARRRRRVVVGVTVVLGAVGLGLALAVRPGDPLFYLASLGVALLWIAGAIVSGPLHLGAARTRQVVGHVGEHHQA